MNIWDKIKEFFKSEDVEDEEEPTDTLEDNSQNINIEEVKGDNNVMNINIKKRKKDNIEKQTEEEDSVDVVDEKLKGEDNEKTNN